MRGFADPILGQTKSRSGLCSLKPSKRTKSDVTCTEIFSVTVDVKAAGELCAIIRKGGSTMKFGFALASVAASALALSACESAPKEEAEEETAEETSEETSAGEGDAAEAEEVKDEEETAEKDAPEEKVAESQAANWTCEDQGDAVVTIQRAEDGKTTITFDNQSEMAAGQPADVVELKAAGGPARMTDGELLQVDFLADGRAEVTDGEGEYRSSYMCAKAG